MTDLTDWRRFYAEEVAVTANLRTTALVEALATVRRESFLPPGPWVIRGDADFMSPLRQTPGDDPRHVYHNLAIGIDPARMLFNGAPGLLCAMIDALALTPGARVLHVGAGTGYYSALMAQVVGPTGRVVAVEVDQSLAATATRQLASMPWVTVVHGNGMSGSPGLEGPFDAILVNAGVTHPEPQWLAALAPGGRLNVPLTATMGQAAAAHPAGAAMANIGKGLIVQVTKGEAAHFAARLLTFVAIYSALGLRDDAVNAALGQAMAKMPMPPLTRFRLDPHEPDASCWCHTGKGCWGTGK
jgi:protein-L-isoaspartate(D-aspartate) O-methyltransferase